MGHHVVMGSDQGAGAGGEAEEIGLLKADVGQAEALGQAAAMHDVIGLEVDACVLALGVGGGEQAEPEAHATAELEVAEGFPLMASGRLVALEQGSEIQPGRGQLAVGTAGV